MLKRLGNFFLDTLQVIVFSVAIFLFVYLLILQPHKIKGISMSPNYPDGEFLLTDKVTYRFKDPKRGDIIVFEAPVAPNNEEFIKRIIGLPGDKVAVHDEHVYINGEKLDEPYLASTVNTDPSEFLQAGQTVTVPADHYFVMGDNREHSSDSRSWGFITRESITGRAWLIYWPLNRAGFVPSYSYNL
jgi:signal peptidase I